MSSTPAPIRVAILDDYQDVSQTLADWSTVKDRAAVEVFSDHIAEVDALVERLEAFDVICVKRERTPLSRNVIEWLDGLQPRT